MDGVGAKGTASKLYDADGPPSVLSKQQIAEHDATLVEWAKTKAIEVSAATRGFSALERFIARSVAEYYAIRDASWTDTRDRVLAARVRDHHNRGGFYPTGRVGTLFDLLRPSLGPSPCRVLCKAAKDESASDLRAVTIDAKIQSVWEAIENVLLAAFGKAQNDPSDDLADERFCKAWDALRDYVPRPKKKGRALDDLLSDSRTGELLQLLRSATDGEAGIPVIDLPKQLQDEGLIIEWLAADLVEVVRRNHVHVGGPRGKLILENGWQKAELNRPDRKPEWALVKEILSEGVELEIRHRVRLSRAGAVAASRLARIGQQGRRENEESSQAYSDSQATTFDRADLGSAVRDPTPIEHLLPFTGGQMEFFPDRVVLCGAVIYRDGRPKRMREVLDSLRQTGSDGGFISYSGPALAESIGVPNEHVARVIRDIRGQICEALRQRGIGCGRFDVIVSNSHGYCLSQKLSVQKIGADSASSESARCGRESGRVSGTVTGIVSGTISERRMKILQLLADGRQLRLPAIASQIGSGERTVRRDLDALRAAGKIEFIGPPRTGYYRLCQVTADQ